jgi:hypothetical protein
LDINNNIISQHIQEREIIDISIVPEHLSRQNSEEVREFEKAKNQMKKDGITKCFICGCENHIEYHHFLAEDCFANDVDLNKLWELAKLFDVYGYAKKSIEPPKSVNDPMNLIPLCHKHHTGAEGIHSNTFPTFIIQKIIKDNISSNNEPVIEDENKLKELKNDYKMKGR